MFKRTKIFKNNIQKTVHLYYSCIFTQRTRYASWAMSKDSNILLKYYNLVIPAVYTYGYIVFSTMFNGRTRSISIVFMFHVRSPFPVVLLLFWDILNCITKNDELNHKYSTAWHWGSCKTNFYSETMKNDFCTKRSFKTFIFLSTAVHVVLYNIYTRVIRIFESPECMLHGMFKLKLYTSFYLYRMYV